VSSACLSVIGLLRPRRRSLGWFAAITLAAGLLTLSSSVMQPASAAADVNFTISSTTGWQQSSVNLTAGEAYTLAYVSGSWTVDFRNFPRVGPAGYSSQVDSQIYQGCKYLASSNYAVLLGSVGSSPAFAIGKGGTFTAPASGRLSLRINDGDACLGDNAGSVTMKIGTPPALPAAGCNATAPVNQVRCLADWSGFSDYPATGYVVDQEATWTVPKLTCPALLTEHPRAGIWVGLWARSWGKNSPMSQNTGWLPQIGTESDCNSNGTIAGPSYHFVWEMQSQAGFGNKQQYGLECPKNPGNYLVCGYNSNHTPAASIAISANDKINAAVAFLGPYTAGSHVRTFEIRLTDLNTGQYVQGYIKTDQSVTIDQIAAQGGTIVEDQPACISLNPLKCLGLSINGLAEFNTPIEFTGVTTLTAKGDKGQGAIGALRYNEWVMQTPDGHQLAMNSARAGSARADKPAMSYGVTWLRRH